MSCIPPAAPLHALALVLLTLSPTPSSAQTPATAPERSARGGVVFGVAPVDVGDLNAHLRATGYPAAPDVAVSAGGRLVWQRDRLLIGLEGTGFSTPSKTSADGEREARLMGGMGTVSIGAVVVQQNRWIVYPMVGIGGGGFGVEIRRGRPSRFDDVLEAPTRATPMRPMILGDLSLGTDYLVQVRQVPRGVGGFFLGLRAGYLLSSFVSDWRLDGSELGGGPGGGVRGPYVRLTLGGWGSRR